MKNQIDQPIRGYAYQSIGAYVFFILSFFLVSMSLAAQPSVVLAGFGGEVASNQCEGLDIIFLVDESASMDINDGNQLRKSAVGAAINIIGDNAVYHCPGIQHRIAVLGFGNETYEHKAVKPYVHASTVISGTIDTLKLWMDQRDNVIKRDIPVTDDLGATDHLAAFKAASNVLELWREETLGETKRKQGLLLITDGGPCVNVIGNVCNWTETEYGSRQGYLDKLLEYTDADLDNFYWSGDNNPDSVFASIIAFRDSSDASYDYLNDKTLQETWRKVAESHGGSLVALPRSVSPDTANAKLTGIMADILNPLLGSQLESWDCEKPIWIEPYLNNIAIIHIFPHGADKDVKLDKIKVRIEAAFSDGESVILSRGKTVDGATRIVDDYTRDGANEHYVFLYPPPGKYEIKVEGASICDDLDVRFGDEGIQGKVISPAEEYVFSEMDEPPYYVSVAPQVFQIELFQPGTDGELAPLEEQSDYPLTLTVRVQGDDDVAGKVDDLYHLARVDSEDGKTTYASVNLETGAPEYIRTPSDGYYTWELVAQTVNPRRFDEDDPVSDPIPVLNMSGGFRVAPVHRFDFQIAKPTQDDLLLVSDFEGGEIVPESIPVSIQLVSSEEATMGDLLDPELLFQSEDVGTFEIVLYDSPGQQLESMQVKPRFGEKQISAEIGRVTIDDNPYPPGSYRISARLLANYITSKYRPIVSEHQVSFDRTEVQRFAFELMQPTENELLPLYDGTLRKPLLVEIGLLDESGNPLKSEAFIKEEIAIPWLVTLRDGDGNIIDESTVRFDAAGKVFFTKLESGGPDPSVFFPGDYQIQVDLTDDYRTEIYRPEFEQLTRIIRMRTVEKFDWRIVEPAEEVYATYPRLRWFPDPLFPRLVVEVTSSEKNTPIPISDLIESEVADLFLTTLRGPNDTLFGNILFEPGEETGQFVAQWPQEASEKGEYEIEVALDSAHLSPVWEPVDSSEQRLSIKRQHQLLNMPWSLLAILILVLLVIVAVTLIRLALGPLKGAVLSFHTKRYSDSEVQEPAGDLRITGTLNRHRYVAKEQQIERELPLVPPMKSVEVIAVEPTDEQADIAADVTIFWLPDDPTEENEDELEEDLYEGINENKPERTKDRYYMELKREGSSGMPLWLTTAILVAFAVWAGVFAYLFFTA